MSDIWRSLRTRRGVAVAASTVVTLAIVGGVVLMTTRLGCGPATALGLKSMSGECPSPVASRTGGGPAAPSAGLPSATLVASPSPGPRATPPATIPDTGPATGAYPHFYAGASGGNGAMGPALALKCNLPVYSGFPGNSGFVGYPGGRFTADPNSAATVPTPAPGSPTPQPQWPNQLGAPVLQSYAYDAPMSEWLPVGPTSVTPDGTRYAVPATQGVYAVDVATHAITLIGAGQTWTIVGVEAEGVYATHLDGVGLWLLPFSGEPREIVGVGFWQAVGKRSAYGSATSLAGTDATNDIIRLDLQTGAVTTWFTRKEAQSAVLGVDSSGAAIVSVVYQTRGIGEVWVVGAPGAGTPLFGNSYSYPASGMNVNTPLADGNGIWFPASYAVAYGTETKGFALYVPGVGVYWMGSINPPVGGLTYQLAGGCSAT